MPAERCQSESRIGWRWGSEGSCFVGPDAKSRAEEVGRAIAARRADLVVHADAWRWYLAQPALRNRPTHVCAPLGNPTLLRELHDTHAPRGRKDARRRRLPVQGQPNALERRYRAQLQRRANATSKLLEAAIQQAFGRVPGINERARRDSPASDAAALINVVNQVERAVSGSPISATALARIGGQVEGFTTRAVSTQIVGSVVPIEPSTTLGVTADLLDAWVADNVALITSLDAQYFEQVRDIISESVDKGRSTATISKLLQQRAKVAKSRADLIATDQVGTLNAKVTQNRQTALGIEEYIWSNSGDSKVRTKHKDTPTGLGETVRRWDTPHPTEGHPGEPPRCRCSAIAVIP